MLKAIKTVAVIGTLALMTACGGGGGGGAAAPVASTEAFPFTTAIANFVTTSSSNNYSITGTVNGVAVTGSGTVTFGNVSSGTFEGAAAQQRTTTATGSITVSGTTVPLNSSSVDWFDSNNVPLGESGGDDYIVVTGTPTIPATVRVNDTGSLYTANRYADSTKAALRGTLTVTYVVTADTATTVYVTLIREEKNTFNASTSTGSAKIRMNTAGAITRINETLVEDNSAITITY
jgi:hypothetical protein